MRERAIRFGSHKALVGVVTEPDSERAELPAVVFLNSGILHHVGASRLYVRIARRLADHGFLSLRFDLAGVGDSEPRRDSAGPVESAMHDGTDALDWLASVRGVREAVLVGLCSGSDMAFHLALEDPRVVGIANLDAWAYRTWKYYARRYGPRLLDATAWRDSIRVRMRRLAGRRRDEHATAFIPPEYRRTFPERSEVEEGLRTLLGRGVRIFHFFSGGMEDHLNHADQYRAAFPSIDFGDALHIVYRPDADHTVTGLGHQEIVVDAIVRWVHETFTPAGELAGSSAHQSGGKDA